MFARAMPAGRSAGLPRVGEGALASARPWVAPIAAAALFLLALLPRTAGGAVFVTPDEDNWMRRTGNFARALERGQLERTYQSGHPGVTTMWVARLGLGADAARLAGSTPVDGPVTQVAGFLELLARARTGFAVANAMLLVVIALLAWRLLGPAPAALAGVLMALDPFLVAHSQVVHLDALSAGLIAVSVLAGVVYWWGGGERGYLLLCGVAAGLGVLTKAPSLFLAAFLPLVALGATLSGAADVGSPRRARVPTSAARARLAVDLAICAAVALATVVALWPALWVAPVDTVRRAVEYQLVTAGTPHGPGNFFLGQPTADPGWLFYPVAVAFRLTPIVVVGLAALAVSLPPLALRRRALLLVSFVLGFALFLAVASKKLDRYALPLFPVLAILAGLGLWSLWRGVRARVGRYAAAALIALACAAQAGALLSVQPYALAYYNPLLGGGPAAQRALLVGWGEGLDQVAAYLNAQPDAARARIAIYYPQVLNFQGLVRGSVQRYGDPWRADYVVDYVSAAQRGQTPSEVVGLQPHHTVQIGGIEYARVYQLTPPRPIRATAPVVDSEGQ